MGGVASVFARPSDPAVDSVWSVCASGVDASKTNAPTASFTHTYTEVEFKQETELSANTSNKTTTFVQTPINAFLLLRFPSLPLSPLFLPNRGWKFVSWGEKKGDTRFFTLGGCVEEGRRNGKELFGRSTNKCWRGVGMAGMGGRKKGIIWRKQFKSLCV